MNLNCNIKVIFALFLLVTITIIDFYTQLGIAIGILHILTISVAAWCRKSKLLIGATITSVISIVAIYLIKVETDSAVDKASMNRIISALIVMLTASFYLFQNRILSVSNQKNKTLENDLERMISQISDYAIILLNGDGKVRNWNDGAKAITGYEENEIVGEPIEILFPESDKIQKLASRIFRRAMENGSTTYESWFLKKDGSPFYSKLTITEIVNYKNEFDGFSLIAKDITNEKKESDIHSITKQIAKVGGWEVDLIRNEVLWSDMTREIHEVPDDYKPNLENGINFYLEGESRDKITKLVQKAIEEGVEFKTELRIVTYKGNIKWIRTKGVPQIIDKKCVKIYGSFQDIDNEKTAQQKLIESEERFRKTFEYSANGMAIISTEGSWLEVNKAVCDIVGYPKEELLKLTFQDITHPEDLNKDLDLLQDLIDDKIESYQMEKRYYHKNGHIIWVILAVSKITKDDGSIKHFISQITDISKRKMAEEELKETAKSLIVRNQELEQFAHITSHDLQEPLRTISSFTKLFETQFSDIVDERGKKYIDFISSATLRMQSLIKGLMEYSRLGNSQKTKKELSLNELLNDVIANLNVLITESQAEIKVEDLPTLQGFQTELSLLFQNLLSNSIKFCKNDTNPLIEIKAVELDTHWQFEIKDNGIGVKKEDQKKIFEIFKRLHGQSEYDGSGIGLAHSAKVVELHQGEIWVESELSQGSTFYFTLIK